MEDDTDREIHLRCSTEQNKGRWLERLRLCDRIAQERGRGGELGEGAEAGLTTLVCADARPRAR